jgi:NAD(P)-dependent dehydrogenase (short-subunit alcohol dehydrogenase family)
MKGTLLTSRTIVITGASDGIGAASARTLARNGDRLVVVGRSEQKTKTIAGEIGADHFVADFSRLDDVRTLATGLLERYPRIDVLANNAGGIFGEQERTPDGFEKTLQVNHLAPFLLTNLLLARLVESGASVINTSSVAARLFGRIDLDDLQNERSFSANKAYGDSKLANILFARALHRRFGDTGLASAAFHPGVVRTSFARDTTSAMRFLYRTPLAKVFTTSPEKGSDTLVWLTDSHPHREWHSGEYYEKQRVARTNPQADDDLLIDGLWERSAEMVGIPAAVGS